MKKILFYSIIIVLIGACGVSEPDDCFINKGAITSQTLTLEDFSRVIVREGIALEVVSGAENRLEIEYNEGLFDQLSFEIIGDRLELTNNNGCVFFTGFKPAKVRLTAVNLTELRNASQYTVKSTDTLFFDSITLISEDFLEDEVNVGDFDLQLQSANLAIVSNNVSNFYISGSVGSLELNFASGQGRLFADELIAENIQLFHRGTSDLLVHPVAAIRGEIVGTGNVIATNRPALIEVAERYTGRLIFRD